MQVQTPHQKLTMIFIFYLCYFLNTYTVILHMHALRTKHADEVIYACELYVRA